MIAWFEEMVESGGCAIVLSIAAIVIALAAYGK